MASESHPTTETGESESTGADGADATDGVLPESVALTIPATADRSEAAAIAVAVGAHVNDRAAAGTATGDTTEQCDRWKLCGRLQGRRPPHGVASGEEWKAAARARW